MCANVMCVNFFNNVKRACLHLTCIIKFECSSHGEGCVSKALRYLSSCLVFRYFYIL